MSNLSNCGYKKIEAQYLPLLPIFKNMKKLILLLFVSVFAISCQQKELTAEDIIDKTIEKAGGENYKKAEISFKFRDAEYKSTRDGGKFQFERFITDSTGTEFHDVLNNEGFTRTRRDSVIQLSDSMKTVYGNSVNSVHYFVQLPYGLKDEAVNKKLLGKDSIEGEEYYEIEVSFQASEEVTDPEDVYLYWIHTRDFTIDYLAYSFEVEGGGVRFRRALNPQTIGGIRFVDYENYKADDAGVPLDDLDKLFEKRELELLSMIENRDIEVSIKE